MQSLLIGTWKLNTQRSEFDPNHRPSAATMTFNLSPEGDYLLTAEGLNEKGEKCSERPARFKPDGNQHPVPEFPGLTCRVTLSDPNTLVSEVRREDGSVVGGGTYAVSGDGQSLTATNFGYDSQLRQFQQKTVWDRS